jgi:hypothetical protein
VRDDLFVHPHLHFIREIGLEKQVNIKGRFMSDVYRYVMNKVLMVVREKVGIDKVMTLIHDGCHVHSTESDECILAMAAEASMAVVGDPLVWSFKPHDFRVKISGSETHTDKDLSALVGLTGYDEDALQIEYQMSKVFFAQLFTKLYLDQIAVIKGRGERQCIITQCVKAQTILLCIGK